MALRYALLGLLAKNDATGYELNQQFKEKMIHFWTAHHTQIYRELLKMEEEGLATSKLVQQVDYPDKKIYSLTEKGNQILIEWLINKPVSEPKLKDDFLLRASMFQYMPYEKALAYLKKSREHHEQGLYFISQWREKHFEEGNYKKDELGEYLTSAFGQQLMETWIKWCDWAIMEIETLREKEQQ